MQPALKAIADRGGVINLDSVLLPKSLYWYQWLACLAGFSGGIIEAASWTPGH